jgi:hypothetical protein
MALIIYGGDLNNTPRSEEIEIRAWSIDAYKEPRNNTT